MNADLGALCEAHRPGMVRYLAGRTRNLEQAEDLVQDAFVKALRTGGPRKNAAAWLYSIVRSVHASAIRDSRRMRRDVRRALSLSACVGPDGEVGEPQVVDPAAGPVEWAEFVESCEAISGMMDLIFTPHEARMVRLCCLDLTSAEIGAALGIPAPSVRRQLGALRARLLPGVT